MRKNPLTDQCSIIQLEIEELKSSLSRLGFDLQKKEINSGVSINSSFENLSKVINLILKNNLEISDKGLFFKKTEVEEINNFLDHVYDDIRNSKRQIVDLEKAKNNSSSKEKNELRSRTKMIQEDGIYSFITSDGNKNNLDFLVISELQIKKTNDRIEEIKPIIRLIILSEAKTEGVNLDANEGSMLKIINSLKNDHDQSKITSKKSQDLLSYLETVTRSASEKNENLTKIISEMERNIAKSYNDSDRVNLILEGKLSEAQKIDKEITKGTFLLKEIEKDRESIQNKLRSTDESIKKIEDATSTADSASTKLKALYDKSENILNRASEVLTTTGSISLGKSFNEQYQAAKKHMGMATLRCIFSYSSNNYLCICNTNAYRKWGNINIDSKTGNSTYSTYRRMV